MTNRYARASGHGILGLAVFGRSAPHAEAIGRCRSQGRLPAWLADLKCPVRSPSTHSLGIGI